MARRSRPRNRLSDNAATYIREAIIEGRLKEGDRLFPERLAEELGISVTPAREGLLTVEGEGFVEMVPRKGFVVSPLSADDVRDIFTSQALICGELASRAAQRMSDQEINELESIQQQLEAAIESGNYESYGTANYNFHRTINVAAAAPKMLWLLAITLRYTPTYVYRETAGWPEASCHDHRTIIRTLRERNSEDARRAMMHHMNQLGDLLAEQIARSPHRLDVAAAKSSA